jgi:hypothetical protein
MATDTPIAPKSFSSPDWLSQILGTKQTTTTENSSNVNPLFDVINSNGNLSPEDLATLAQSITANQFNKNLAPVAGAMTSGMGARTAGNSGLMLAMQQMQQQAMQDTIAKGMEINTARGQTRAKAAGDIATNTRNTTATTKTGMGVDPMQALLLGTAVNKMDKKGWLDFLKNDPAPTSGGMGNMSGGFPASAPVSDLAASENRAATFNNSGGFGDEFNPANFSYTPVDGTGAGLFADVPVTDVPVTSVPDLNFDLPPMTSDVPDPSSFDWSWFADGGMTAATQPTMGYADGELPANSPVHDAFNSNFRRDVHIELQVNPGLTPEQAAANVIGMYGKTMGASGGKSYVDSNFEKPASKGAAPAKTSETLQKGNKPKVSEANLVEQLFTHILGASKATKSPETATPMGDSFSDGGPSSHAGGYNDQPSNSFMSFDQNAMYADGGYPRARLRPARSPRGEEPERRHDTYADGGSTNSGMPIRLGQPAYAYNPPNRAPSVRAPLPGDRGYAGFGTNAKSRVNGAVGVDTSWTTGFDNPSFSGYADGGITNDSHQPFGNTSNNFVGTLSKVITPYADGGHITRNRNYMGNEYTRDTSYNGTASVVGPGNDISVDSGNLGGNLGGRPNASRPDNEAARDAAVTRSLSNAAGDAAINYFTMGLGSSIYKGVTGSKQGPTADLRGVVKDYDPIMSEVWDGADHAVMTAATDVVEPALEGVGHGMTAVGDALGNGLSKPIGGGGLGIPSLGSFFSSFGFADGSGGGLIKGPGTGTSDSIAGVSKVPGVPTIAVSTDEYIVPADVVNTLGKSFFDNLLAAHHTPVRR